MKEQLISLYEYGAWVNHRLLQTASALTPEQFTQTLASSFGSVHRTLARLVGAEVLWFARWQGQSPKTMLSLDDLPTLPAIRERWAVLTDERRMYLGGLNEAEFATIVRWTNMRGQPFSLPRWQVMLHCANHATHHRSEVATMLTELGHEPDSTELVEYYLSNAGQPWKPSSRS